MKNSIFCAVLVSTNQMFTIGFNEMMAYKYNWAAEVDWPGDLPVQDRFILVLSGFSTPKTFGLMPLFLSHI